MVTTAPKSSRHKRLHIVFFTDASVTKSTSISFRRLGIVIAMVVGFFAAAGASLWLYQHNKAQLSLREGYIRELKSAFISYAVTDEKSQMIFANEGDPQNDIARKIALEIQHPNSSDKSPSSSQSGDTLANLQSSLSSLSTVSANLARNDDNAEKNFQKSGGRFLSDAQNRNGSESAPVQDPNSNEQKNAAANDANQKLASPSIGQPSGLSGIQVEQGHTTEINGNTTFYFQLVNTTANKGQNWSGRVCGVAEVAKTKHPTDQNRDAVALSARKAVSEFIAIPGNQKLDSARPPNDSCSRGLFVRFSRLRPIELVIPARQESIKKVTVFFVESGSNRVLSQDIEF